MFKYHLISPSWLSYPLYLYYTIKYDICQGDITNFFEKGEKFLRIWRKFDIIRGSGMESGDKDHIFYSIEGMIMRKRRELCP